LVIEEYLQSGMAGEDGSVAWEGGIANQGVDSVALLSTRVVTGNGRASGVVNSSQPFFIEVGYLFLKRFKKCRVGIILTTVDGTTVLHSYDEVTRTGPREAGEYRSTCRIPQGLLTPGVFVISINIGVQGEENLAFAENVLSITVEDTEHPVLDFFQNRKPVIDPQLDWKCRSVEQL
jgi:hypothetical protein